MLSSENTTSLTANPNPNRYLYLYRLSPLQAPLADSAVRLLAGVVKHCLNAGMPSPVGHALGGLAAGWLTAGALSRNPPAGRRVARSMPDVRRAALFMALGTAPDLDLLAGSHSTYTHSIGAVLIVGLAALALTRQPLLSAACAAAWGSHVLFDWLGADSSLPLGIMALWPFTTDFYQSPITIFMAISRRYWRPGFYAHNTTAVARELLILVPIVWIVWRTRADGLLNSQPSTANAQREHTSQPLERCNKTHRH